MIALELGFARNALLVSATRRYVQRVLEHMVDDKELVERGALVVHELLENGAKYAPEDSRIDLALEVGSGAHGALVIRLTNPTTAAHVRRLEQFMTEIQGASDPNALYVEMMCRDPFDKNVSGLGLARIRAEADMSLDLHVAAETATIVARAAAAPTSQAV
jgi:cytosine/adenosine deaminase-related metal-dependent hydrolase